MQQRYFFYYLLARTALILLIIFIFPEIWIRNFLQSYRRYLLLISIAYFTYCYYLHEEEKKFQQLRSALLVFSLYLTLHVFFRPLLNIEPALFILLACIIGGLRYVSKLHIKIKRPFYLIGGIFSFLILISGVFYLYPDAPDVTGFQAQQQNQLLLIAPTTLPKKTAYLLLTDLTTHQQQNLFFQTGIQFIHLPATYQLNYISTSINNEAQAFIISSTADLLQILPQSTLTFQEKPYPEIWTFSYYPAPRTGEHKKPVSPPRVPNPESWVPTLESSITLEAYEQVTAFYRIHFQSYLAQQIGSVFLTTPTIQQINKTVLFRLSKIFPGFLSQNIENYYQFEYYFSFLNQQQTIIDIKKYTISNSINTNNNLFQQLKKNIQLSTPNLTTF